MSRFTPGGRPTAIVELPRLADRITFLYLERCIISREDNAITASDARGTLHIPGAGISCLLLGPGTTVTHQAMNLLGDSGVSILWVGEGATRVYACGRPLSRSTRYLQQQARMWADDNARLRACRRMYEMRFPDDVVDGLTLEQLRGKEGARVRAIYQRESRRTGVRWHGRVYQQGEFEFSDPVNQALTAANAALYGVTHAAIEALGLSPGLGFVHSGGSQSFVHDVADLYKADLTIPIAFEAAAEEPPSIASHVRVQVREAARRSKLLPTLVRDLRTVLEIDQGLSAEDITEDLNVLWDELGSAVPGGTNYEVPW
jgi:CRISPR-associated protein Cas1